MSIFHRTIIGIMVLTGLWVSLNSAAHAQSQYNSDYTKLSDQERNNWEKNQAQMTNDIMRAINGPKKDPNLGVVSQSEMLDLVIGAFNIDKNDGGQSYRQFQDRLSNKVLEKRNEVEDFEAYKQDWIRQERARQQAERAAREAERERIYQRNLQRNAESRAKFAAEKKRRAERYAAAQRRKNAANTVSTSSGPSGKYADDGLDDLPPPLIVVTPEQAPQQNERVAVSGSSTSSSECDSYALLGVGLGNSDDYDKSGCYNPKLNWQEKDWYLYGEGPCHVAKNIVDINVNNVHTKHYLSSDDHLNQFNQQCQKLVRKKKEVLCPKNPISTFRDHCRRDVVIKFLPCLMDNKDYCESAIDYVDQYNKSGG